MPWPVIWKNPGLMAAARTASTTDDAELDPASLPDRNAEMSIMRMFIPGITVVRRGRFSTGIG